MSDTDLMRAFVVRGPSQGGVELVERPVARRGAVVVDVERVGLCGTDRELFRHGPWDPEHLGGKTTRLGHEWVGRVSAVDGDDEWLGRRVTGDTMLSCGECRFCRTGRHQVCPNRSELGVWGSWPGAMAEQVLVPVTALKHVPEQLSATEGALIEPGGNAWRAIDAVQAPAGERVLVWGAGSIGLLAVQLLRARGVRVHAVDPKPESRAAALAAGAEAVFAPDELSKADAPGLEYIGGVEASGSAEAPGRLMELVESGGRLSFIGVAHDPVQLDPRMLSVRDMTAVGILGASAGLEPVIDLLAEGRIDGDLLLAGVVALEDVAGLLAGDIPEELRSAPKIQVDPNLLR